MTTQSSNLSRNPATWPQSPDITASTEGSRDAYAGGTALLSHSGRRVLVVENDADEAGRLVRDLRRHGHEVTAVETGDDALRSYHDMDLILFDLDLPDLDGLEVCRSIRSSCDVPMIAVTGRATEVDRVLGLRAGADDYLVKPYGFHELMARIEAVMRRVEPRRHSAGARPGRTIEHGSLRIDAVTREVRVGERRIDLTRKEFDLLHVLAQEPGAVVQRTRLMSEVWGDSWSRRTVDTHVSSLRNKLGASSWVLTVRGVGFRLGHA